MQDSMQTQDIIIVGAGGHAKVVCETILESNQDWSVRFVDDSKTGDLLGFPIVAPIANLDLREHCCHLAIGDNSVRRKFKLKWERANYFTVVNKHAVVSPYASIGQGCFIAAGSIIAVDAKIGVSCIVNHGAVVDHDCDIGDFCHIAPNATLGGGVTLGEGVLVGANATILPGLTIGDWVTIGAGAVVTKNQMGKLTVKGNPAK